MEIKKDKFLRYRDSLINIRNLKEIKLKYSPYNLIFKYTIEFTYFDDDRFIPHTRGSYKTEKEALIVFNEIENRLKEK